jgi:hypothetical protein
MSEQATLTIATTDRRLKVISKEIDLSVVRDAIGKLESLCDSKNDAASAFKDYCKLVALQAHIDQGVLASYVTAIVNAKVSEVRNKAEQLDLLFTEI